MRKPFRWIVNDVLGDLFAFDTRFFRTLRPLALSPGLLAARYLEGHRVSYVAPLRTYVFASVLFFAVAELIDARMVNVGVQGTTIQGVERANEIVNASLSYGHFFLIPVFALFLMALFRRPPRYYIEHLVFALYFGAFAFLLFSVVGMMTIGLGMDREADMRTLDNPVATVVAVILYATIFGYFVVGLKRFYGRSWKATIARAVLVSALYLMAFSVAVAGVFLVALKLL